MPNWSDLENPGLTVALALMGGIVCQSLARHIRLPGIVLLLFAGVILGPDALGLVRPELLTGALRTLVGFAVAIILFEGGLSLNFSRLRSEERAIRQLISLGALVTWLGGTLAARFVLGWSWSLASLFGTLVIVTGPTVVQPLLRRVKVERAVSTVLEAEGVLIDAVGAIVAVVALEVALNPSALSAVKGVAGILLRLGFGAAFGAASGYLLARIMRVRGLVPEGLQNVFVLCSVVGIFQISNAILGESGIATVTLAGIVMGNIRTRTRRELQEFKEQLTVMFIGMLFILLAADVRLADVRGLGDKALWVVALLMFLVRPLTVFVGTWRTHLRWRQKLFISWIGPRGIVAAAVAAFFVTDLEAHGVQGAKPLQALVFLVIFVTVVWAGLTGGVAARVLKVRRRQDDGWLILGAHELARTVAHLLKEGGEDVVLIESEADLANAAQEAGLRVVFGNGLDESVLVRAGVDSRAGALALTSNEEMNSLFLRHVFREAKLKRLYACLRNGEKAQRLLEDNNGRVMFGQPQDVDVWSARIRKNQAVLARYRLLADSPADTGPVHFAESPQGIFARLVKLRDGKASPISDETKFKVGDEMTLIINKERQMEADDELIKRGWEKLANWQPPHGQMLPAA